MMRIYSSLVLLLLYSTAISAELPVSFTSVPTIKNIAIGQTQTLNYVIHNNVVKRTVPIRSIQIINDGDTQPIQATRWTSTCGNSVPPNGSCSISVIIENAKADINRHLSINYGGRSPLVSPIKLHIGKAKYSVFVYIIGSDLQADGDYANKNINQMLEVGSSEYVNVILETGGAHSPGYLTVKRQIVYPNSLVELKDLGNVSMGSPDTVQDFLTWGMSNYPADRYIAIFWDHGGGPNGGFGYDQNNAPRVININQLATVFKNITAATQTPFEIVGFDACLMGNAETASGFISSTNYFLASEDIEPGNGWQYNSFLKYLNANPDEQGNKIGKVIIDGYTEQNATSSTTLSLISTQKLPDLVSAMTNFSTVLTNYLVDDDNWKQIATSRFKSADYYTSVWDNKSTDVVDLVEFAQRISAQFPIDVDLSAAAQAIIATVNQAVVYYKNSFDRADSYGLTVYFPSILAQYQTQYPTVTSIGGISFFSHAYIDLVENYHAYYQNNINTLSATLTNLAFDGTHYTATITNDYNELYAAVGNESCTHLLNQQNQPIAAVPCYTSIQYQGINAVQSGNNWDISFEKSPSLSNWPLLNGMPVLFIPDDATPNNPEETNFLIPVTWIKYNMDGYLNVILNQQNQFTIKGFQSTIGSTNTAGKIFDLNKGDSFRIRSYAERVNNAWFLTRTSDTVHFPLTLSFGNVSSNNNAFRFLAGDITGALIINPTSEPY